VHPPEFLHAKSVLIAKGWWLWAGLLLARHRAHSDVAHPRDRLEGTLRSDVDPPDARPTLHLSCLSALPTVSP